MTGEDNNKKAVNKRPLRGLLVEPPLSNCSDQSSAITQRSGDPEPGQDQGPWEILPSNLIRA